MRILCNAKYSHILSTKNNSVFACGVGIYLTSWGLSDDVKLTKFWTTVPWLVKKCDTYNHTVDMSIRGCNMHGSVSRGSLGVEVNITGRQPLHDIKTSLLNWYVKWCEPCLVLSSEMNKGYMKLFDETLHHYGNMPMQYTEIFSVVKFENFQKKFLIFFLSLLKT